MKQNKKLLIILSCIIVAILIGILVLTLTQNTPNVQQDETENIKIKVFETDATEDVLMTFNFDNTFTLSRRDGKWSVLEKEYIELDESAVQGAFSTLSSLYASRAIEPTSDLLEFGIDTTKPTATLEYDGKIQNYYLGNILPDQSGYYCLADGHDFIYVISKYDAGNISAALKKFRYLQLTNLTPESITEFSINGENGLIKMKYQENAVHADVYGVISNWKMSQPHSYDADNEAVEKLVLTPISNIVAMDVLEDSLKAISKNRMPYSFDLTADGKKYSFRASFDKEYAYVFSEEKSITYVVSPASLSFLSISFFDVAERFLSIIDLNTLDTATVTAKGKSVTLKTQGTGNEQKYFIDNKEYSLDDFRPYYQALISGEVDGEVPEGYSKKGDMIASINFTLKDKSAQYFEFYDYDDLNCSVYINGKCLFYMRRSLLDYMLKVLN